nr:MAG TPA: hypothetical protein [Caudoviricetes sp.]
MGRKPSATSCSTPTEHTLTELNERLPPLTNTKTCLREHEQNNRPTLQICCPFHCFLNKHSVGVFRFAASRILAFGLNSRRFCFIAAAPKRLPFLLSFTPLNF